MIIFDWFNRLCDAAYDWGFRTGYRQMSKILGLPIDNEDDSC